jgi:NADH-quinone oxidoreductase subunit L
MGGIWKLIPVTYALMWIGNLALAGVPPFAGFFSKDIMLEAAYAAHSGVGMYAFVMGTFAALLTAFYSWRLLFLTFHGAPRADHHTMEHVHESPQIMLAPLYVLAVGAVIAGFALNGLFVGDGRASFWGNAIFVLPDHDTVEHAHHVPLWVKLAPTVAAVLGISGAYLAYIVSPEMPARMIEAFRGVWLFLYNKWYFDELYDFLFVRPAFWLGRGLWKGGDGAVIDGLGPDGIAATTIAAARRAGRLQTGYVYHYAFAMLIGVVILASFYLYRMGR